MNRVGYTSSIYSESRFVSTYAFISKILLISDQIQIEHSYNEIYTHTLLLYIIIALNDITCPEHRASEFV